MKFTIIGRIKFRAFFITFKEFAFEKEFILAPTTTSGTYDLWQRKDSWASVGYEWTELNRSYKLKFEAGIKNSWLGKVKLFNHTWVASANNAEKRILVNDRGIFLEVKTEPAAPTGVIPAPVPQVPLARPAPVRSPTNDFDPFAPD